MLPLLLILMLFPLNSQADKGQKNKTLSDTWYVFQTGSTPWGYYHEFIEEREGQYSYRWEMTKRERNVQYQEFIGALAKTDLTPITFNMSKNGQGAVEIINGNYKPDGKGGGAFHIEVQGARTSTLKLILNKNTIMESFFHLWVNKNRQKMTAGSKHSVQIFSEDHSGTNFSTKAARILVKGHDKDCLLLKVSFKDENYDWCIDKDGIMKEMVVGGKIHVKRVSGEKEARSYLK